MGSLPLHHARGVNAAAILQADCGLANGAQVDIQHQPAAGVFHMDARCAAAQTKALLNGWGPVCPSRDLDYLRPAQRRALDSQALQGD
jgi:hypothetical protein